MSVRLHSLRLKVNAWVFASLAFMACGESDDALSGGDTRSDGDAAGACHPGYFQDEQGCVPCALQTWSDGRAIGQCLPKQDCQLGTYVTAEGDTTQDRRCEPCPSHTTTTVLNQPACTPGCLAGAQWLPTQQCESCSPGQYCAGGQSEASPCDEGHWDHDHDAATACVPLTACQAGTYRVRVGSALSDTQCLACETGTYSATVNAPACQPWQVCARDEIEYVPGSARSDTQCVAFEWLKELGTIREQIPYSVRVGPDGDVYVGGTRYVAETSQKGAVLRRYTPAGDLVWEWLSPENYGAAVLDIAITPEQVVVVGEIEGLSEGSDTLVAADGFVLALRTLDGQMQWSQFITTPAHDSVHSVAMGAQGDIYIAGESEGLNSANAPSLGKLDGFISKYTAEGEPAWLRVVGTAADDTLKAIEITQELGEVVYALGTTQGQLPSYPMAATTDLMLVKYTSEGMPDWFHQIPVRGQNVLAALSDVSQGGGVCTSHASLENNTLASVELHCFDPNGSLLRRKTLTEARQADAFFAPKRMFSTPEGGLWLVGETYFEQAGDRRAHLSLWTLNPMLEVVDTHTIASQYSLITLAASRSMTEPAIYSVGYALNEQDGEAHGYLYKLKAH